MILRHISMIRTLILGGKIFSNHLLPPVLILHNFNTIITKYHYLFFFHDAFFLHLPIRGRNIQGKYKNPPTGWHADCHAGNLKKLYNTIPLEVQLE